MYSCQILTFRRLMCFENRLCTHVPGESQPDRPWMDGVECGGEIKFKLLQQEVRKERNSTQSALQQFEHPAQQPTHWSMTAWVTPLACPQL